MRKGRHEEARGGVVAGEKRPLPMKQRRELWVRCLEPWVWVSAQLLT